jgi:hypothetical protein
MLRCTRALVIRRVINTPVTPVISRNVYGPKLPPRSPLPKGGPSPDFRKYARMENAAQLFTKYRNEIIRSPLHHFIVLLEDNPGLTTAQLWAKLQAKHPDLYRSKLMMKRHLDVLRENGYIRTTRNILHDKLPKGENGYTYMVTMKLKKHVVNLTLKYALQQEKLLATAGTKTSETAETVAKE